MWLLRDRIIYNIQMDRFTDLPSDMQIEALLRVPPQELHRLCQVMPWPICTKMALWKKHNSVWGGYIPPEYLPLFDLWGSVYERPTLNYLRYEYREFNEGALPQPMRDSLTSPIYPPVFVLYFVDENDTRFYIEQDAPFTPLDIMNRIWYFYQTHPPPGHYFEGINSNGDGYYRIFLGT